MERTLFEFAFSVGWLLVMLGVNWLYAKWMKQEPKDTLAYTTLLILAFLVPSIYSGN